MNFESKNGLYFDLDSLYDTRLGTLDLIDSRVAKIALVNGYDKRQQDKFPFVDKKTFRDLYKLRDKEVLDRSMPTRIPLLIGNFIKDSVNRVTSSPYKGEINVYLNVYPFKLSQTLAKQMLEPLAELTGHFAHVHILNLPPEKIDLRFCREHFSLMVMYDFEDWLEIHTKNEQFKTIPIPDITLFVPELYLTEKVPTVEELRVMVRESMHPFRALERMAKNLIDLNMISIDNYCALIDPRYIEELKKEVEQYTKK